MGKALQKWNLAHRYGEFADSMYDSTLGFDEITQSMEATIRDYALGR
jgi:hypothetical protein